MDVDPHTAARLGGGWSYELLLEREGGAPRWERSRRFAFYSEARNAANEWIGRTPCAWSSRAASDPSPGP